MRRWLAIILLSLLPLQFSWAAVASYCGHEESTTTASHLGHHEHQHHADEGVNTDAGGQKAAGAVDLDCGHCHGTCAAMPLPVAASLALLNTSRPGLLADVFGPAPPERPQWAGLA
jgi:hypothetical protein